MLDELYASGTVSINDADQSVQLLKTSYQPLSGSEDQLAYLSQNMADHLNAATENILGQVPPHFERAVHYCDLTAEQIEELKADYNTGQMALLEKLSQKAAEMKNLQTKDARHRFRAGGYFFHVDKGK
jgi:ABC-type Fe2+-enterobactin transport system substrate-binding protein